MLWEIMAYFMTTLSGRGADPDRASVGTVLNKSRASHGLDPHTLLRLVRSFGRIDDKHAR